MDTVSRQAAIDAARKCPVKEVTPAYMLIDKAEMMTELMCLPSAQPELPTDDCISRQAAIDALKNRWKKTRNYEGNGDAIAEECELYLKQVPSAQPENERTVI